MLRIPEYEIVYCRKKAGDKEIYKARKEMARRRKYALVSLSVFLAIILYIVEYFFFHSSTGLSSIVAVLIFYGIISILRLGMCIPREWAVGIEGIYISYPIKRLIGWETIKKVEKAEHGVIIHTTSPLCSMIYLIGDTCIEKIMANAYISSSF